MSKDNSYDIIRKLWKRKTWISNMDFMIATDGSPKFTTRISELRKRGIPINKRTVKNDNTGRIHAEYALADGFTW